MLPPGTRFSKAQSLATPHEPAGRPFPRLCRPMVHFRQRRRLKPPFLAHCRNPSLRSRLNQRFRNSRNGRPKAGAMAMTILKWALIFFLVSVVAGILGFTGVSAASADVARFLFYAFVVIFLVLLILGLTILRV
jgi:uncharacterized membrane protein YtjA (UPF0391 family)